MPRLLRTSVCTLCFAVLALVLVGPASAQEVDLDWLPAYIEEGMADWGIPGMAVAVVHNDEVVFAEGFGVRSLNEPGAVDAHTVFGVASTTKAMTAASLAMLVERGELDWDTPVVEYMPEFQLSDPWVTARATPRDLLAHRVGVGRMTGNRLRFLPDRERSAVLHQMRHHDFEQPFRQGFVYSNVMYSAAGELIPAITDTSWDDFLREQLFDPLGMERTTTSITQFDPDDENIAAPHQEIEGTVRPISPRNFDNVGPSASVNTSVTEMAQWMRLHLGTPGVYEGRRLIDEALMREMHSAQNPLAAQDPYTEMNAYGLGWSLREHRGHRILQHGGATDGMNTNLVLLPEEDVGIVVMTNTFNRFMTAVGNEVLDAFLGERGTGNWHPRIRAAYEQQYEAAMERRLRKEARRQEGTSPTFAMDAYTGTYTDELYLNAEVVTTDEGALAITFWDNEDMTLDLEHWHHDTFRAEWRNPAMREKFVWFDMDDSATIQTLNVRWTLRPVLLQVGIYPTDYYREVAFERVQ